MAVPIYRRVAETWIDGLRIRVRLNCGHHLVVRALTVGRDGEGLLPRRMRCRACEAAAARRAA